MSYILGLLPAKKNMIPFIQAAQSMFNPLNDGYLLNEDNSLPHVTLCAFECDSSEEIERICEDLQSWKVDFCSVRIMGLLLKKGSYPPYHYSVGLAVARDAPILALHEKIHSYLMNKEIYPINPSMELYQPHLTLAGIAWKPSTKVILESKIDDLISIPLEEFRLVLGKRDEIGQFLEILYEF